MYICVRNLQSTKQEMEEHFRNKDIHGILKILSKGKVIFQRIHFSYINRHVFVKGFIGPCATYFFLFIKNY